MRKAAKRPPAERGNIIQFTLPGLIVFTLALVLCASVITCKLTQAKSRNLAETLVVDAKDKSSTVHAGPWGILITRDIELERPLEYLTDDVNHPSVEKWCFNAMKPEAIRALLAKNGLSEAQLTTLLAPQNLGSESGTVVVKPPGDFLESLDPDTRQQLYVHLAGLGLNTYLDFP
jgi:hypothetical protein